MSYQFQRQQVAEKYQLKEVLYGLRELWHSLKGQKEIEYEVRALKRAMTILNHEFPRRAKDGRCPNCGHAVDNFYCPECGQSIHWQYRCRPIDEKRIEPQNHRHNPQYFGLLQRREVDEYIRVKGIEWVLEKLTKAERIDDPIDRNKIRDYYLESQEGENDE